MARRSNRAEGEVGKSAITRNVKILSLVSFAQDAASDLLYPILPLFITTVLGAPPLILGAIEGTAEAVAAGTKAYSGRLADRRRRKPLVFLGYSLSALAKPLIGLAGGWPLVLVARALDRTGKGIRTSPRDAMIASETSGKNRGAAFGFHRAADSAGAVVGPLLGLAAYYAVGKQLRPLFFLAFIPAAISVALIGLVRERPQELSVPPEVRHSEKIPLSAEYWKLMALIGTFGLVNFADVFLLLRARQLGLGFEAVIAVYVLYNLVYALVSYPAGKVSDRMSRQKVFGLGLGVFGVVYLGFAWAQSPGWIWVLMPLYGCYTALTDGVGKAWVADLVPRGAQGKGIGYFHAVSGMAALVASLGAGAVWGARGFVPFTIAGVVALCLSLFLLAFAGLPGQRSGPEPVLDPAGIC